MDNAALAVALRDLLVIAKVAMPPKLFAEDPRVIRGMALLKQLEPAMAASRPPAVNSRPPKFDIRAMAQVRAVAESSRGISFAVDLPWDLVEALTDAQSEHVPLEPSEAVNFIMRDWLTAHGNLPLSPSKEEVN